MKVVILGIDGYLGWPLALHLINKGHEVHGVDNFERKNRVWALGCDSLTKIEPWKSRNLILREMQSNFEFAEISLGSSQPGFIRAFLDSIKPDAIVHLAEQPSAPWSMMDVHNASITQYDNVIGTLQLLWAMHQVCPEAHLVKLGTMGEYGTPNCDIPEGEIPEVCSRWTTKDIEKDSTYRNIDCPMSGLPFPRQAGSWYHLTKVHDTHNIMFACRNWELSSTDIMQGVVFGVKTDDITSDQLITRFDYDEVFGTVINRFCAQALLGHPLTVYGLGGQTRGFLPIQDSIICMTLALENPPQVGEYRTFNQFERTYSVSDLAGLVKVAASEALDFNVKIKHYENPRKEMEAHYYNPTREKLVNLGYKPTTDILPEIEKLLEDLYPYRSRIKENLIVPETRWDSEHRRSDEIMQGILGTISNEIV